MKKHTIMIAAAMLTLTATAQETYQAATLLRPELNGTARYVGMGGTTHGTMVGEATIHTTLLLLVVEAITTTWHLQHSVRVALDIA